MPVFYKVYGVIAIVTFPFGFFWGWRSAVSFLLGVITMLIIVYMWDLTLRFTLSGRKTTGLRESLFAYLHYILLGVWFYGIISLFVVTWAWFVGGTVIILPGLLITTFFVDRDPPS